MKIALLFLTLDNINQPEYWNDYITNQNINIYVHAKYPDKVTIPWMKKNLIKTSADTSWGFIVHAYILLFKTAFENKENIKFITISESCIPIQSFDNLYKFLKSDNIKTSYIKKLKISKYDREERIKTQKNYERINFIKHLARFCLSRYHVQLLLNKKEEELDFFYKMHVGDEFFLSLIAEHNYIKDFSITFDNWNAIDKQIKQINNNIKLLYEKIESKSIENISDLKKNIKELQDKKKIISPNPKSYSIVNINDINEAKNTGSFFWRKFPKDSNVIKFKKYINQSRNQSAIEKLYFIHIPKTAGTSIEDIIYNYGGCIGNCYFKKNNINKNSVSKSKYKIISQWHIPLRYIHEDKVKHILENKIIFAIIRNPYERIISDFKFWISFYYQHKSNTKYSHIIKEIINIYNNNFTIDPINLNLFINNILTNKKYKILLDGHFIPMYKYIYIKKKKITNDILRFDNLNDDFNKLINKYNLKIPIDILKSVKKNRTSEKLSINDIDLNSKKLIDKIYRKDFKLLYI